MKVYAKHFGSYWYSCDLDKWIDICDSAIKAKGPYSLEGTKELSQKPKGLMTFDCLTYPDQKKCWFELSDFDNKEIWYEIKYAALRNHLNNKALIATGRLSIQNCIDFSKIHNKEIASPTITIYNKTDVDSDNPSFKTVNGEVSYDTSYTLLKDFDSDNYKVYWCPSVYQALDILSKKGIHGYLTPKFDKVYDKRKGMLNVLKEYRGSITTEFQILGGISYKNKKEAEQKLVEGCIGQVGKFETVKA